jgi:uncharacterized LabA/DUF88 family protein
MMNGAIFVDVENVTRHGGWAMRYRALRAFVEAQGATVVCATAYLGFDAERESQDADYRDKKERFRSALRHAGFRLVLKEVRRHRRDDGRTIAKANADVELVVDAMLQADRLDLIVIVSGDGDFVPLVRALQSRGKRVDVVGFEHTSRSLRREADRFHDGFAIRGLVPANPASAA